MARLVPKSIEAPIFMYLHRRLTQVGVATVEVDMSAGVPHRTLRDLTAQLALQELPGRGQE